MSWGLPDSPGYYLDLVSANPRHGAARKAHERDKRAKEIRTQKRRRKLSL